MTTFIHSTILQDYKIYLLCQETTNNSTVLLLNNSKIVLQHFVILRHPNFSDQGNFFGAYFELIGKNNSSIWLATVLMNICKSAVVISKGKISHFCFYTEQMLICADNVNKWGMGQPVLPTPVKCFLPDFLKNSAAGEKIRPHTLVYRGWFN
jgi:hypothetical protein